MPYVRDLLSKEVKLLLIFEFLSICFVPLPSPAAWQTDGVREVTPQRTLTTRSLGQKFSAVEQRSAKKKMFDNTINIAIHWHG